MHRNCDEAESGCTPFQPMRWIVANVTTHPVVTVLTDHAQNTVLVTDMIKELPSDTL